MEEQSVTVLATRRPNQLLVRHHESGLELFVDFSFRADQIDILTGMLGRLGTSVDDVAAVLMTHMHGDHYDAGGLREFLNRRRSDAAGLPFHVHRDEPLGGTFDPWGLDVGRFDDAPFTMPGPVEGLTVQPVRMTHTPGCCAFRIGDDYIGCDASVREVFSERVLEVLLPPGGRPVRRLFLDMEAIDRETVRKSDFTEERKRNILATHGFISDLIAVMERPELKGLFGGLVSLVCLHVTPGINDASGRTNARLIREARDRLGFTFEVPVVPAGIQNLTC